MGRLPEILYATRAVFGTGYNLLGVKIFLSVSKVHMLIVNRYIIFIKSS